MAAAAWTFRGSTRLGAAERLGALGGRVLGERGRIRRAPGPGLLRAWLRGRDLAAPPRDVVPSLVEGVRTRRGPAMTDARPGRPRADPVRARRGPAGRDRGPARLRDGAPGRRRRRGAVRRAHRGLPRDDPRYDRRGPRRDRGVDPRGLGRDDARRARRRPRRVAGRCGGDSCASPTTRRSAKAQLDAADAVITDARGRDRGDRHDRPGRPPEPGPPRPEPAPRPAPVRGAGGPDRGHVPEALASARPATGRSPGSAARPRPATSSSSASRASTARGCSTS